MISDSEYTALTPHTMWPGRHGGRTYWEWSGMAIPIPINDQARAVIRANYKPMPVQPPRNCTICGTRYEPMTASQKTCSEECAAANHKLTQKRNNEKRYLHKRT